MTDRISSRWEKTGEGIKILLGVISITGVLWSIIMGYARIEYNDKEFEEHKLAEHISILQVEKVVREVVTDELEKSEVRMSKLMEATYQKKN